MMCVMARGLAVVAVLGAALGVWADVAAACTCADRDERDRLESGEKAIIGRVLSERQLDPDRYDFSYRVRVERAIGVRLSGMIELGVDFELCGTPRVGARQGIFIRRRASGWVTDGCSIVEGPAMARALRPYRRPLGSGRVALLAGGHFGDSRVMALDARGRIIGYGQGRGEARDISVCPGALRAAELVVDGRSVKVAVRDLRSLQVVRSAAVTTASRRLEPGFAWVNCADGEGTAVHVAAADYIQRTRFDRVRIWRADASGVHRVAVVDGSQVALAPTQAYVTRIGEALIAVDLANGRTQRLTVARTPEFPTASPDAARVAFYDSRLERLRVVDVATGAERSLKIRYGTVIEWLDAERLLYRTGGTALVFDTELRRIRRYPFVRMYGQAHVAGRLYGTDRYRLRSLDLATGRKRTVAELTDRGVADLVGVPERPLIEPGRRRPSAPTATTKSSSPAPCGIRSSDEGAAGGVSSDGRRSALRRSGSQPRRGHGGVLLALGPS
jgi:hypothetical protein